MSLPFLRIEGVEVRVFNDCLREKQSGIDLFLNN